MIDWSTVWLVDQLIDCFPQHIWRGQGQNGWVQGNAGMKKKFRFWKSFLFCRFQITIAYFESGIVETRLLTNILLKATFGWKLRDFGQDNELPRIDTPILDPIICNGLFWYFQFLCNICIVPSLLDLKWNFSLKNYSVQYCLCTQKRWVCKSIMSIEHYLPYSEAGQLTL